MTNRHQIEKIYKPVIESDQNIIRINSGLICRKPVRHFICGIFIERTSDSDCCDPWLMITALFLPKINPNFAFGTYIEYLKRPETSSEKSWRWSDPVMIADAIAVIETEVLPKLEFYGTPEGYVTLPPREHTVHYEPREDRMLALIAAGNLDAARTILHEQEPKYRGKTFHPASLPHRWQMQLAIVAEPLLAGDRRALARILHGWEAANVRGTKIEPYRESTAFPLEAGLG